MNLEDVEVGMKVKVVSLKNTCVGDLPVNIGDIVEVYGVKTNYCDDNNTLELFDEWSISHLDVELVDGKVNKGLSKQEYDSLKKGDKLKIVSLHNTSMGDANLSIDEVVTFLDHHNGSVSSNDMLVEKCDGERWYMSSKDVELIQETQQSIDLDSPHVDDLVNSNVDDLVNSPKHYATDLSGVECIQIKRKMSANLGDAFKYCWRVGKKWDDKQDLEKALWYINDAVEHDVPVWLDDGVDLETEALIQQVLKHREGWQYMFINALYWGDLEEAKRAVEIGIKKFEEAVGE